MSDSSYSQAITVQARVLWALSLREIHGKHGKSRLGYIWQLIKTGFNIAVFWGIREIMHAPPPHGMSMILFLLMGFVPFFIFSSGMSMVKEAVKTNLALLTFPQITALDLCLGSWIVAACTEVVVLGIYMAAITLSGVHYQLYDALTLFCALGGMALLGLGVGLTFNVLSLYFPTLDHLVPMFMRIMFFISGLFYSPTNMGPYGKLLYWNPVLNYVEMARGTFVSWNIHSDIKVWYTIFVTIGFLALGLLLERFARDRQGQL